MFKILVVLLSLFPTLVFAQSYELNLNDLMDTYYGVGNWSKRTAISVGSDIEPAITLGVNILKADTGRGIIKIPPGSWLQNSTSTDLSGIIIQGAGSQASKIIYNNNSGIALYWSGANAFTGGGAKGLSILLESGLGDTLSYGILLRGNSQFQPDQTEWNDIYMSAVGGSSFWWDGFHADGSARSIPQGIRVGTITNMQVFNCRNVGIYASNLVQWTYNNMGTYTGKGPYGNNMLIQGGSVHNYGIGVNSVLSIGASLDTWINGIRYN